MYPHSTGVPRAAVAVALLLLVAGAAGGEPNNTAQITEEENGEANGTEDRSIPVPPGFFLREPTVNINHHHGPANWKHGPPAHGAPTTHYGRQSNCTSNADRRATGECVPLSRIHALCKDRKMGFSSQCQKKQICCLDPGSGGRPNCGVRGPGTPGFRIGDGNANAGNPIATPAIISGTDAVETQFCWQASVVTQTVDGPSSCGGSVLNDQWILTAAHCVPPGTRASAVTAFTGVRSRLEATDLSVVEQPGAGVPTFSDGCRQRRTVRRIVVHEQYVNNEDGTIAPYDIALLELNTKLDMTNPCTCPICLPREGQMPAVGMRCVISGHGSQQRVAVQVARQTEPRPNSVVQYVVEGIVADDSANCAAQNPMFPPETIICAGGVDNQGSCQGDSGGPLVCYDTDNKRYWQVGLVSGGAGCGAAGFPGAYTDTEEFLPWILANTGAHL